MRARAVCVTGDLAVRTAIERALAEAGVAVDHRHGLPTALDGAALLVIDQATRRACEGALRASGAPVVIVGDDLDDDELIALMLDVPVNHVVGDRGARGLAVTSEKLVSGDYFGLEKYVARGAEVHERAIASDHARNVVIAEVCAWSEARGARRPLVHRIASVVDELVMNALLDAPRDAARQLTGPTLRWAGDDDVIAISVSDAYGTLQQRDVLDNVRRARARRGRPQARGEDASGAGLGLYLVLANVASLVVNLEPGLRTEVVCLFDLARRDRRAIERGTTSLHVFAP